MNNLAIVSPWPTLAVAIRRARRGRLELPLDPFQTCRDAALEQRPVEPERQRQIAALDHRIGLCGAAGDAADRDATPEDSGLGPRDQILHRGIVDQAALVDRGGEVARTDHGD